MTEKFKAENPDNPIRNKIEGLPLEKIPACESDELSLPIKHQSEVAEEKIHLWEYPFNEFSEWFKTRNEKLITTIQEIFPKTTTGINRQKELMMSYFPFGEWREYQKRVKNGLGEHRTQITGYHLGIDLITESGTDVSAIARGMVIYNQRENIKENIPGIVIICHTFLEIDTEKVYNMYSMYKNINNNEKLKIGQNVEASNKIGEVSDIESVNNNWLNHLHFQIFTNESINKYLGENSRQKTNIFALISPPSLMKSREEILIDDQSKFNWNFTDFIDPIKFFQKSEKIPLEKEG